MYRSEKKFSPLGESEYFRGPQTSTWFIGQIARWAEGRKRVSLGNGLSFKIYRVYVYSYTLKISAPGCNLLLTMNNSKKNDIFTLDIGFLLLEKICFQIVRVSNFWSWQSSVIVNFILLSLKKVFWAENCTRKANIFLFRIISAKYIFLQFKLKRVI